jgi:hypothetical protein
MCEAVARVLLTTECVIEYSSDALSRATAVTNDMSGTRREERREERGEGVKRMREAPRPINHSHNSTVTTPVVLLSLSLSVEAVETSVGSSRGFLFIAFTTQDYLLL